MTALWCFRRQIGDGEREQCVRRARRAVGRRQPAAVAEPPRAAEQPAPARAHGEAAGGEERRVQRVAEQRAQAARQIRHVGVWGPLHAAPAVAAFSATSSPRWSR